MSRSLALVALASLLTLSACGRGHHGFTKDGKVDEARVNKAVTRHLDDRLDDLDATADQKAKVAPLKDALVKDAVAFYEGNQPVKKLAFEQWQADRPDAAAVKDAVHARLDALRALADKAIDSAAELHGILTPKQRAEITEELKDHCR